MNTERTRGKISGAFRDRTVTTRLFEIADLGATLVFAVEGAAIGVQAGLDLLGVLVVAFCTALVGGVLRDVILGDTPPLAFRSLTRIMIATAGGLVGFFFEVALLHAIPTLLVQTLDAVGLALFAVAGSIKALGARLPAPAVVILGTLTAVGGGVVRDVLVNQTPAVLSGGFYASAAVAGVVVLVLLRRLGLPLLVCSIIGFVVCITLRLLALFGGWHLPSSTPR